MGKILASKAEVLIAANAGKDQINSHKQLREFGVYDQMKIVSPLFMPGTVWSVGVESVWGSYAGGTFYWEDDNPATKKFSDKHWKRFNRAPSDDSSESYEAIMELFGAIERAKTTKPVKIVKELEGNRFGWTKGQQYWRPCDHVDIQDIYFMGTKKPKKKYDTFTIIDKMGGEEITQTCEEKGHRKDDKGNWIRYPAA